MGILSEIGADYWEDDEMTDMIRYDRLCSEYCGWCNTRHHPDEKCQVDVDSICGNYACCGAQVFNVEGNVVDCWECLNIIRRIMFAMSGCNPFIGMTEMDRTIVAVYGVLPREMYI